MELKIGVTKDISIVLTRLLWIGYYNKINAKKIDAGFANVSYKVLGDLGYHYRNVKKECEKLTSILLWISFYNLTMLFFI